MLTYLFSLFFFIFGLCVGSFLNCVIYRLKAKKSLGGRSFCPKCKHQLKVIDLIPVFSFIIQNGKCRYCKKKISIQYPIVELISGLLFLAAGTRFFIPYLFTFNEVKEIFIPVVNTSFLFIIFSFLIIIFFYDLKYLIIPDRIVYPAIGLALGYWLIIIGSKSFGIDFDSIYLYSPILNPLPAALGAGGFFYLLAAFSDGKWIGGGDIKLAFLMGLVLSWPNILIAMSFAFISGSVVGVILMFLRKKKMHDEIPFGPFLVTGTFFAIFFGNAFLAWYLQFLGIF